MAKITLSINNSEHTALMLALLDNGESVSVVLVVVGPDGVTRVVSPLTPPQLFPHLLGGRVPVPSRSGRDF